MYQQPMYQAQEQKPVTTIRKFVLTESKTYREPWLRPYNIHVGYEELNKIQNVVDKAVNTNIINGIDNMLVNDGVNILQPSETVIGSPTIVNGWGERRLKFVLLMEIFIPGAQQTYYNYIQGYTSYFGITNNGIIDPNMEFYINSVTRLRKTFDPHTGMVITEPISSYNVVNDEFTTSTIDSNKLARPVDIVTRISSFNNMDMSSGVEIISNVGSVNNLELVSKNELLPVDHVGTTIKTAINSRMVSGTFAGDDNVIESMVGNLITPGIYQIEFFKYLFNIKGKESKSFVINDLKFMDPNVENVVTAILNANQVPTMNIPNQLLTDDTAETYDASYETRMSTVIHEATSTLLTESLLSSITFTVSNATGTPVYSILDVSSYIEGLNLPALANKFIASFINKVWNYISQNNMMFVNVLVSGMLESDTTIAITTNNNPEVIYRYPTFADSKFLPLIMDNSRLDVIAEDYKGVVETTLNITNANLKKNSAIYEGGY